MGLILVRNNVSPNSFISVDKSLRIIESLIGAWFDQEMTLIQGNQIGLIPKFGSAWSVSFEFKPIENPTSYWGNILHNTIGDDIGRPGDRIPSVW